MAYVIPDSPKAYVEKFYESGTLVAHRFVMAGTADTQFKPMSGVSDVPIGLLAETTAKTTIPVALQYRGVGLVEVGTGGATMGSMGKLIDSLGKVTDGSTYGTDYIVGRFLEDGSAGDLVLMDIYFLLP